jgi:hypothetical protein
MNKTLKRSLTMAVGFILLIPMMGCAFAVERTFRGKVIDYDTREPIEGAVVVAYWNEATPTIAGESTRLKEVKETLTDKNGEWSMIGEEGEKHDEHPYWSFITGRYYTRHPLFIIFKPGYEPLGGTQMRFPTFRAFSYIDKEKILEGIILSLRDKEWAYFEKYEKRMKEINKYPEKNLPPLSRGRPFSPAKDPDRKLQDLDIPFDYPEDIKRVTTRELFWFETYTIVGLRKLAIATKEERLRALPDHVHGEGALEKQKEFLRLLNEESRNLGLKEIYKERAK